MAVTFETPDPGIKDRPYVEQLPLDALFRGMGYKQQEYDQNYQQLQGETSSIDNIQATPGSADEMELQNIKDAYHTELKKFNGANLMDPNTKAKLSGLISSATKALISSGIPQRSAVHSQIMEAHKDAQQKGKPYENAGLDQINSYVQNGKFDPSVRFTNDPINPPDYEKLYKTLHEVVRPSKREVTLPNGEKQLIEEWDPKQITEAASTIFGQTPDFDKHTQMQFNKTYGNTDWNSYNNDVIEAGTNAYNAALTNGNGALAKKIQAEVEGYKQQQKMGITGEAAKARAYQQYKSGLLDQIGNSLGAVQEGQSKLDEYHKIFLEEGVHKREELYNKASELYKYMDPTSQREFEKTNPDYSKIDMTAAQKAEQSDKVKLATDKATAVAQAKATAARKYGGLKDSDQIPVNGELKQYGTWKKEVLESGAEGQLYKFLQDNPDAFKAMGNIDVQSLKPTDIKFVPRSKTAGAHYQIAGAHWWNDKVSGIDASTVESAITHQALIDNDPAGGTSSAPATNNQPAPTGGGKVR